MNVNYQKAGFWNSIFCFLTILLFFSCSSDEELNQWTLDLAIIGSNGSPKCTDLNNDGVLDIVIGAGRNEFQPSELGIIAINGKNGDTLWTSAASDQMFSAALFQDVNNDGIQDVYIGGRSMNFYCLNGKNGKRIWKYELTSDEFNAYGFARFNFFNPRFLDDLNDDGLDELLVLNSGNVYAAPYDTINRYPGVLMILNGKNGEIMALDTMPDGKESYLSPAMYDFNKDGTQTIIFGTGGETVSGSLYAIELDSLKNNSLRNARQILEFDNQHGFIAPSTITDFNNDGYKDLLALNHGGIVSLHDGKEDFKTIWKDTLLGVELNAQATVGYYNNDQFLDIFINGALGQWPENTGSKQFFINGKNGDIMKTYELGCSGFSSPLSMNADEDSLDEALLYVNEFDCDSYNTMFTRTTMYIFKPDTIKEFSGTFQFGKNISSTPWIGDIDNDQKLDLISLVALNTKVFHEFLGMKVIRNEYEFDLENEIKWNSYMNDENSCVYE